MAELVVVQASETLTHIALRGRLDLSGVEHVELELTKQTVTRRKPAIVDISAVEILASIGVGMLVRIARTMHSHGVIFGVVATGLSKDILERLKVNEIFPVLETYDDAVRVLMLE